MIRVERRIAYCKLKYNTALSFVLVYNEGQSLLKYETVWIAKCYLEYDAMFISI